MTSAPRARRFALTFYAAPDFVFDESQIRYFVAGEEVCPETKRTHWQAYIELFKVTRLGKLKSLVDDQKVHVEPAKGSPSQNVVYCKKDGKVYREEGTISKQGKRTDLISLREHFKSKKKLKEAVESDELVGAFARYPKFVNTLQLLYSVERSWTTELYVYWGPTGTGKSHTAYEEAREFGTVYFKPEGPWFDGYEGEDVVIFEDFRGETGLAPLLRLADKYPMRVPIKGGFRQFVAKRIYITSNVDIDEWFNTTQKGYEASMGALRRRITVKKHFAIPFTASNQKEKEHS